MNQTNSALLDVLTREGVLINVSVRYWRGCKKLKAEDLGLDADDVSDRLISLGHKRLLPKDATADLALIESRAHAIVVANTFPFVNGLGHFLPNPKLGEVTDKLRVRQQMPTRNTAVLQQIIDILGDLVPAPAEALKRLEEHFGSELLIVAGATTQVAAHAETLRLAITTPECALVLDYIAHEALASIRIDQVEQAINTLFPDRFVEP